MRRGRDICHNKESWALWPWLMGTIMRLKFNLDHYTWQQFSRNALVHLEMKENITIRCINIQKKRNGTLHSLHQILNWKTPAPIYTWSVYLFAIWYTYFRLHWPLYWPGGAHELSRFTFHICVWSPEQSTQPWSHPTLPSSDARPLNWWGPLSRPLVWLSLRNRRR